ncbi:MAG: hypothetical protein KR126chlam3_00845 [Chlamydiae bacterium]|nr:hypothetical protein [Chlamydiota bacterium]
MNKNIRLLAIILLSSGLLSTGCDQKNSQDTYTRRSTQPAPEQYSERDYRVWVGPGWYYGVYFSNEGHYRDWRRRNPRRYYGGQRYQRYHGGRYYHGGRGFHGGRDRHHGGRGRHGGGRGGRR